MKTNRNTQPTPTMTAEYLYSIGHASAYIALRARGQYSAFIADLNRNQYSDRIAEAFAEYASRADQYRASHSAHRAKAETLREEAERLYAIADNVTTQPADRRAYIDRADELSREADRQTDRATAEREQAEDTERTHNSATISNREDVVHEAITAYLEFMNGKDWNSEEAHKDAFLQAIKRAGAYAHTLASISGATHTSTTVISMTEDEKHRATQNGETITDEEAERRARATRADIIRKYGSLDQKQPFATRGGMLDGFVTYEHRDTPRHKGYFKVTHYKRIAPKPINDEALNIAIRDDFTANYDLQELLKLGKFSEREACALCLLAEVDAEEANIFPSDEAQTVAEAGQKAVDDFRAQCDERKKACTVQKSRDNIERQFKRNADQKRQQAEIREAFKLCGTSENALDMAISRFRAKLEKAIEETHRQNTAPVFRGLIPQPEAMPTVTVYSDQSTPATEYSTITPAWIESPTKPHNSHDENMKREAERTIERMTIKPDRMTAEDYRALWAIMDTISHTREELPNEARRADILKRKAEEAHQSAQEARRTADSYSQSDRSPEARRARLEAVQAEENAQNYSRRAREQAQDVQRMRDFIKEHTR